MRQLHAHWRVNYVRTSRERRGSPFSLERLGEDPRRSLLLHRSAHAFVVMNRYPYNAGHLLVLPVREVGDLAELGEEESIGLWREVLLARRVLAQLLRPDGFNLGFNLGSAAGAGVPGHLHCHLVPRWDGDTNFMPVIGEVKVLPEALESLYDRLLLLFQAEKTP